MATKKNEVNVEDILESYDTKPKPKDNNKVPNQSNNDWGDADEANYVFKIAGDQGASKKTQKKKATIKGWAEAEAAQKDQPKASDFSKIQEEEQKKKIIKKPGAVKQAAIDTGAEYFPSLGEERPKQAPKKAEPVPVPVQQTPSDGFSVVTGPKKFMNAKKAGTGESFAPLNPTLTEKPVPVAPVREKVETSEPVQTVQQTRAPGVFQRSTAEQPQEVPTDTKFKFGGGEGPRKFIATGNKISFKREEEKDEHEALRLQKEREMEEKLLREKEELAKQREARKAEGGDKKERAGPREGGDGEEKRIARFSNAKKEGDKPNHAPHVDKQPVVEEPADAQPAHAKEVVEMHGALSNKGWGDGPLRKVKK